MGASDSKTDAKAGYQWKASGAPSVSMPVMDSLQSSPETDASRAKLVEQQIQARVSEELKKLSKQQGDALAKAHESLAAAASKLKDEDGPTTYTVGKEVDALRKKLDERKSVRDLPESVETARTEVVRCLRDNDRRPLDCWEEVERFKNEVKKLEKTWVDKVTA